jgi:bifunctional ADP-heptose synthase (sugar kinase/adenylyltransferase)
MMRLDAEVLEMLKPDAEKLLLDSFAKIINQEKPQVVILEDYNKGVFDNICH